MGRIYDRTAHLEAEAVSIQPGYRERPRIMHHAAHTSREAETTRVDRHPEFNPARSSIYQIALEAPPPRHGYTQRWVSDGTHPSATKSERLNWVAKQRQGWSIRAPETVPPELRHIYPSTKLSGGQDTICVATMVLMEMPVRVAMERNAAVDERINHQKKSVIPSTQELAAKGQGRFGPLQIDDQERTYRGRAPQVMQ